MGVLLFQETPILGGWVYHHPWVGSEACLLPMGLTSENVAAAYGIPRDRQDSMAADSHKKAGLGTSHEAPETMGVFHMKMVYFG